MYERSTWVEVNLAAIRHNVQQLKSLLPPGTRLCAVVKADGYGHGAVAVARAALEAGADSLAVALLNEGMELRRAGITAPILVLGYTPPFQASLVVAYSLTQTIFSLDLAQALASAAASVGRKAKVHLKIDTGMTRLGIKPEEAGSFAAALAALPELELEGVFSHFADADNADQSFTLLQWQRFKAALKQIKGHGIDVALRHIANSAATLNLPETHLDMVRVGIALYGLWPSSQVARKINLRPAMKFKTTIIDIKKVPPGTAVSYGCSYVTSAPARIAVLPVGYADGWSRLLSDRGRVIIHGQVAPVVGRVCMDHCMVDVTDIPEARTGDEVVLFDDRLQPVEEIARLLGTINYEVVCLVGKRVPRVYLDQ